MGFEKFEATSGRGAVSEPVISLRSSGGIGINKVAMAEWFADAEAVAVYMDEEANEIGLEPLDEKEQGTYTLSRTESSGSVAASAFLRTYDLVPDQTTQYRGEWDDDAGMVVVDLDEPIGTYGSADDSEE